MIARRLLLAAPAAMPFAAAPALRAQPRKVRTGIAGDITTKASSG